MASAVDVDVDVDVEGSDCSSRVKHASSRDIVHFFQGHCPLSCDRSILLDYSSPYLSHLTLSEDFPDGAICRFWRPVILQWVEKCSQSSGKIPFFLKHVIRLIFWFGSFSTFFAEVWGNALSIFYSSKFYILLNFLSTLFLLGQRSGEWLKVCWVRWQAYFRSFLISNSWNAMTNLLSELSFLNGWTMAKVFNMSVAEWKQENITTVLTVANLSEYCCWRMKWQQKTEVHDGFILIWLVWLSPEIHITHTQHDTR